MFSVGLKEQLLQFFYDTNPHRLRIKIKVNMNYLQEDGGENHNHNHHNHHNHNHIIGGPPPLLNINTNINTNTMDKDKDKPTTKGNRATRTKASVTSKTFVDKVTITGISNHNDEVFRETIKRQSSSSAPNSTPLRITDFHKLSPNESFNEVILRSCDLNSVKKNLLRSYKRRKLARDLLNREIEIVKAGIRSYNNFLAHLQGERITKMGEYPQISTDELQDLDKDDEDLLKQNNKDSEALTDDDDDENEEENVNANDNNFENEITPGQRNIVETQEETNIKYTSSSSMNEQPQDIMTTA